MSETPKTDPWKTGMNPAQSYASRRVASERAPSETAGPAKVVAAVATGSASASSAIASQASAVDIGHSALAGDRWPRPVDPIEECSRIGARLADALEALEDIERNCSLNGFPEDAPDQLQTISGIVARALARDGRRQPTQNDEAQRRRDREASPATET